MKIFDNFDRTVSWYRKSWYRLYRGLLFSEALQMCFQFSSKTTIDCLATLVTKGWAAAEKHYLERLLKKRFLKRLNHPRQKRQSW